MGRKRNNGLSEEKRNIIGQLIEMYLVKGLYKTITGIVLKVDQTEQRITIRSGADTEVIPFSDIYRITKPT